MKRVYKLLLVLLVVLVVGCKDFDEMNSDPNKPDKVFSYTLIAGVEKQLIDLMNDAFSGCRQSLPYAQYWCQRNYTEEDRYQVRESTLSDLFNNLYIALNNIKEIIRLNSDPATMKDNAAFGNNTNQIAAATILKVFQMQMMVDIWGDIPYSEAFLLEEGVLFPKYDKQEDIYKSLIDELTTAVNSIIVEEPTFTKGDLILQGNSDLWKRFGNSLKCKLALRLSKVDPNWKTYIDEAVVSGVFENKSQNAVYKYSIATPNECEYYKIFFTSGRNDFVVTKPFVNLLKGVKDTLNGKNHPWPGVIDPRIDIFTDPLKEGMPYGLPNSTGDNFTAICMNFKVGDLLLPVRPDFSIALMTYAEVCFILSERNGYDKVKYEEGIKASLDFWSNLNLKPLDPTVVTNYVAAVTTASPVDAEAVATQKYIHLYMNGYEAWAEYRRTGFPKTLLKPGEITAEIPQEDGSIVSQLFVSISDTKGDIPARLKYPIGEQTVNGTNLQEAVGRLDGGVNSYYSKIFWDTRNANGVPIPNL